MSQKDGARSPWYILEDTTQVEASVAAEIVGPESTSRLVPAYSTAAVAQLHAASQANSADQLQVKPRPTLKLVTPK